MSKASEDPMGCIFIVCIAVMLCALLYFFTGHMTNYFNSLELRIEKLEQQMTPREVK